MGGAERATRRDKEKKLRSRRPFGRGPGDGARYKLPIALVMCCFVPHFRSHVSCFRGPGAPVAHSDKHTQLRETLSPRFRHLVSASTVKGAV